MAPRLAPGGPGRRTALHDAAIRYRADNITYLLDHGAAIYAHDADGNTPLLAAIRHGSDPEAARILIARHADLKAIGKEGYMAIRAAPEKGWTRLDEGVLSSGACPNTRDADGVPVLFRAVNPGRADILDALTRASCDLDVRYNGGTALMEAVRNRDLAMVKPLGRAGADVRIADRFGATPIKAAKWDGDEDIAGILADGARCQAVGGATRRM